MSICLLSLTLWNMFYLNSSSACIFDGGGMKLLLKMTMNTSVQTLCLCLITTIIIIIIIIEIIQFLINTHLPCPFRMAKLCLHFNIHLKKIIDLFPFSRTHSRWELFLTFPKMPVLMTITDVLM